MGVHFLSLVILLAEFTFRCTAEVLIEELDLDARAMMVEGEDGVCSLEEQEMPEVQIVFLVDAALPATSNWPMIQREVTRDFMEAFKEKYTVEFALTAYHNWQDDGKECYTLLQSFTKDPQKIMEKLNALPGESNLIIHRNCSLTMALLMTVVDQNLHWDRQLYISSRVPVRKFVVTYPLRVSATQLTSHGNRRDALGDGTDTCQNSKPPTPETLQRVLVENNVVAVMEIVEVDGQPMWTNKNFYFKHMFPPEFEYVKGHSIKIGGRGRPYKHEDINSGRNSDITNKLFPYIRNLLTECYWEDPSSYNTLGL